MPDPDRIPLPRLEGHGCFACGTANPIGLQMSFYRLGDVVRSDVTLGPHLMGWDRIAHGGIVSTLLDEIMAYAVIALRRVFFVTRRMSVEYRRPVPLETPLIAEGAISPEPLDRGCVTLGRILDKDGNVLAEARAEMVTVPVDKLALASPDLVRDMKDLFAALEELD